MNGVQSMTQRRERLKHELREEILAAARDLFVKEGYESVSLRKIAERVGCSPGTIYLYYADKAAILNAICIETFARLDKRMEAIAQDPGDPLERLRRGARAYMQFGLDHPGHYFVTFALGGRHGEKSEMSLQAGLRSFNCLRDVVKGCVQANLLRSDDVEQIAQSLWAIMHGLVMLFIGKPGFPFIEQSRLIESVLDIGIEGIRKR